jgi:Rod binding domain-containing protein
MAISQLPRLPLPQESPPAVGLSYPLTRQQELKPLVASGKSLVSSPVQSPGNAKKAADQFESFFLYLLLKEMDKTIDRTSSLFGDGLPDEFVREMYYEQLADKMVEGGGIGLSKLLAASLAGKADAGAGLAELSSIPISEAAILGLQALPE